MILPRYKFFLVSLNWILLLSQIELTVSAPTKENVKLSKHPVLLVVSFDGFRFDYMTKANTPNLRALQNEGVTVPFMQAQFPTKTFPNHQSIATGLYPDSHGITDNVVYDPLLKKKLSGFLDEAEFWSFRTDVLPFWIRNEQAGDDRFSGCYMWAGSSQGYGVKNSLYPTHYIPKYNGSVPWENRVETVISWLTNDTKPANIVFLYHNEPDSHGHSFGTEDAETILEIEKTDERAGYLIQQLKNAHIYDQINLIILSDHGMQTVTADKIIKTTAIVDVSLYYRHGGSPLFHIQPKDNSTLEMIYEAFKTASESKNFTIYKKHELTHLNYTNNRRIMDLVLLADPGYAFEDTRLNDKGVYGVHGYDNRSPNMTTIFMARGPLFKKGYKTSDFLSNVDLFPLFSKIMDVPLSENNGSLATVSQFLIGGVDARITMNLKLMITSIILINLLTNFMT